MDKQITVYWAASLHEKHEQERNIREVTKLRAAGFNVYLPQEHGVWEDMVEEQRQKDPSASEVELIQRVRKSLYEEDRRAIDECNCVVAYVDRHPSEGTLWEMGYAVGIGVPVILVNACKWNFNLMPEFGSTVVQTTEQAIHTLLVASLE